jgi:hypothetical protein
MSKLKNKIDIDNINVYKMYQSKDNLKTNALDVK